MVARDPLHRSGRADFPHPARALGNDARAAQRIVMVVASLRRPAVDQPVHAVPGDPAFLTAARERTRPEPTHLKPECRPCGIPWRLAISVHRMLPSAPPYSVGIPELDYAAVYPARTLPCPRFDAALASRSA